MTSKKKSNLEELDLSSLFFIRKGFLFIFNFIGCVFKGFFHLIISCILFLKQQVFKITIAAIIGLIVGFFIEVNKPITYTSDLMLQPNFNSARQLYSNVDFYNDLVKQKDTLGLEKIFQLEEEIAASLKEFTIVPIRNQNDIISSYNELILDMDALAIKNYDFDTFKASFTDFDYKKHKITVVAEKSNAFNKLTKRIISSVENNEYFINLIKLTNENLNRTDSIYRQNIVKVDSLRKVYIEVLLTEAKKKSNGTNINLGNLKHTTKEIELFETNVEINEDLKKLLKDKFEKQQLINIIYDFQPIGNEVKEIKKNLTFQLPVLSTFILIITLLLFKLNHYLINYKKEHNNAGNS
ncbi:hypothetical protein N9Q68_01685 [Polaribacter sp.]|nr:hypothetical protein [Polaribacter sp.]